MKKTLLFHHILSFILICILFLSCGSNKNNNPLNAIQLQNISITDNFWSPKLQVLKDSTIPHSWQYISPAIEEVAKAAGNCPECEGGQLWWEANLYKFIETVAHSLSISPDKKLEHKIDSVIELVASAQEDNGYIHAYVTNGKKAKEKDLYPWGNLYFQHDGYVTGHLIEAAIAYYQATQKRKLLDVAIKASDHAYNFFVENNNPGFPGHAEMELALVRLYRITKNKNYLRLAERFIKERGKNNNNECPYQPCEYYQDHLPISQQNELVGHAVRSVFFANGVAEVAMETKDPELSEAAQRLYDNMVTKKIYITGSVGVTSHHEAYGGEAVGFNYELPHKGYCESCGSCGVLDFSHRMLQWKKDGRYADMLEKELYNSVLHGIALNGKEFYYQNPELDSIHPRGNNWTCCPPNLSRTILNLGSYIYSYNNSDVFVNLFVGNTTTFSINGKKVQVKQETNYPWDGKVIISILSESKQKFKLSIRIPDWCNSYTAKLNGKAIENGLIENGYLKLERTWEYDELILDMKMPVELMVANPLVKTHIDKLALQRGPLIYGFEKIDNPGFDIALTKEIIWKVGGGNSILDEIVPITGEFLSGKGEKITALPFYAMANRGLTHQKVWIDNIYYKNEGLDWEGKLYQQLKTISN